MFNFTNFKEIKLTKDENGNMKLHYEEVDGTSMAIPLKKYQDKVDKAFKAVTDIFTGKKEETKEEKADKSA